MHWSRFALSSFRVGTMETPVSPPPHWSSQSRDDAFSCRRSIWMSDARRRWREEMNNNNKKEHEIIGTASPPLESSTSYVSISGVSRPFFFRRTTTTTKTASKKKKRKRKEKRYAVVREILISVVIFFRGFAWECTRRSGAIGGSSDVALAVRPLNGTSSRLRLT